MAGPDDSFEQRLAARQEAERKAEAERRESQRKREEEARAREGGLLPRATKLQTETVVPLVERLSTFLKWGPVERDYLENCASTIIRSRGTESTAFSAGCSIVVDIRPMQEYVIASVVLERPSRGERDENILVSSQESFPWSDVAGLVKWIEDQFETCAGELERLKLGK